MQHDNNNNNTSQLLRPELLAQPRLAAVQCRHELHELDERTRGAAVVDYVRHAITLTHDATSDPSTS
jgi:hypothetical protein